MKFVECSFGLKEFLNQQEASLRGNATDAQQRKAAKVIEARAQPITLFSSTWSSLFWEVLFMWRVVSWPVLGE